LIVVVVVLVGSALSRVVVVVVVTTGRGRVMVVVVATGPDRVMVVVIVPAGVITVSGPTCTYSGVVLGILTVVVASYSEGVGYSNRVLRSFWLPVKMVSVFVTVTKTSLTGETFLYARFMH
jgi:hypothetical protein